MVKASVEKILFVTVIASLIGLPLFAQAQDKPLKKISWGVTSLSASNWIPWIAKGREDLREERARCGVGPS